MSATSGVYNRIRALVHLILLQSLLPVSVTYVMVQLVRRVLSKFTASKQEEVFKVKGDTLVSSTSTTDVSRLMMRLDSTASSSEDTAAMSDEDDASAKDSGSDTSSVSSHNENVSSEQSESSNSSNSSTTPQKKEYTVVLTGGKMSKTLHFCRCLRSYADANPDTVSLKIVVCESQRFRFNATRCSRSVNHFVTITSPRGESQELKEAYMNDIYNACVKYNATHFIPVAAPVEAVYDAQLKSRLETNLGMTVQHMDHELCCILDDKHRFGCFLRNDLKIESPQTYHVTNNDEVRQWNKKFQEMKEKNELPRTMILKNLQYDPIHRLDLFQLPTDEATLNAYLNKIEHDGNAITPQEPWQLQEFLAGGEEYALMIVVRSNHLVTMTCSRSSASQLNYIHVEVPAIRTWVESFMTALQKQSDKYQLTGQLCFDFMVVKEADGSEKAYPIECNPRVHTQCTIYNSDDTRALLGQMLLNDQPSAFLKQAMVEQLERDYGANGKQAETYWFYNEFLKIFPNDWLLKYCDDKDMSVRKELASGRANPVQEQGMNWGFFLLYLPSFLLPMIVFLPLLLIQMVFSDFRKDVNEMSFQDHVVAMYLKFVEFVHRLADTSRNVECDMWDQDWLPFLAKNHFQVPIRLLATIRTGVEWKKIDFAIGKVVEVGGD